MPQRKPRQVSPNEAIRRRIQKWEDEDPSSLLTKQIEKATAPLQGLVALLLPDRLVQEMIEKTLWASEALVDRDDVLRELEVGSLDEVRETKLEQCDHVSEKVQFWAVGGAAALSAWDLAGPLGIGPSLLSLFTLAFRTIKKIGLCYGYDTSQPVEELIALEIFVAASTLYHRDKSAALGNIADYVKSAQTPVASTYSRPTVEQVIEKVSRLVGLNLTKRRTFAGVPALGALVVSGANAWLIQDVSVAARNVYSNRRLQEQHAERAENAKKKAERASAEKPSGDLTKVAVPKAA